MSKKIEITLDDHCEDFITEEIASGTFADASEVVHQAIQLMEKHKSLAFIEGLIQQGKLSGEAKDFDRERFIADMKAR